MSTLVKADYTGYQDLTTQQVRKNMSDIIGTNTDALCGLLLALSALRHASKTHCKVGDSCFGAEFVDLFGSGIELQESVIDSARKFNAVDAWAGICLFKDLEASRSLGDDGSPFFIGISCRHAGGEM